MDDMPSEMIASRPIWHLFLLLLATVMIILIMVIPPGKHRRGRRAPLSESSVSGEGEMRPIFARQPYMPLG
jgi:hypothetical protein